jgi:predicted amidophosphoribosyltransferase
VPSSLGGLSAALADLVLPGTCAGCAAERVPLRFGTCAACVAELEALRPYPTSPVPPPPGMPPCVAVGGYSDPLRSVLLGYKERGRHRLARPLGALLAAAVTEAAVRSGGGPGVPLLVLPVPSTARAIRQRHGDHMRRMAAHAVRRLRAAGWQAELTRPLRMLPRPDSASLDAATRFAVAENSLRIRMTRIAISQRATARKSTLIVVDDIVTTGASLAAVTSRLREVNVQVTGTAVVAATELRRASAGGFVQIPPWGTDRPGHHLSRSPNEG